jgi:TfoX/Sxy family transcriptional regulator of competence genes
LILKFKDWLTWTLIRNSEEERRSDLKEVGREILDAMETMEENLDDIKQGVTNLNNEIDACLEKSAKTEMTIEEIFELLYANVEVKRKLKVILESIDKFSKMMSEYRKKYLIKKTESPPKRNYKVAKGDQVDEMLGNWINTHGCEIEIRRLGGGFYMFGEKKIYAKIINGKLIIRVGGGYMNIDEFMQHYGMMELARQQRIYEMEYESLNYDELMSTEDELHAPADRHGLMGSSEVKKNLRSSFGVGKNGSSPLRGSPRNSKGGRGSPGGSFVNRHGSPKTTKNKGSPRHKAGTHEKKEMPSSSKIEESIRKMDKDAKDGKLKDEQYKLAFRK